jgi:hypothetical protein
LIETGHLKNSIPTFTQIGWPDLLTGLQRSCRAEIHAAQAEPGVNGPGTSATLNEPFVFRRAGLAFEMVTIMKGSK